MALSSEVTFPHKKSAHRKVRIKRQLSAEGWPQSLEKAGLQLSPIWPPTEALLPAIALYCAPSKEECAALEGLDWMALIHIFLFCYSELMTLLL